MKSTWTPKVNYILTTFVWVILCKVGSFVVRTTKIDVQSIEYYLNLFKLFKTESFHSRMLD